MPLGETRHQAAHRRVGDEIPDLIEIQIGGMVPDDRLERRGVLRRELELDRHLGAIRRQQETIGHMTWPHDRIARPLLSAQAPRRHEP